MDHYPGLSEWWREAEGVWTRHRSSDRLTLKQRLDFRRGLQQQLPPGRFRVVYGKSGMHVAAALVDDPRVLVDHKLYWCAVVEREEAEYLCAVINSPIVTDLVRPLMSYGKDERDIDKHLWRLPIPRYDGGDQAHREIARLGKIVQDLVAALQLPSVNFVSLRRQVRKYLANNVEACKIDRIVTECMAP